MIHTAKNENVNMHNILYLILNFEMSHFISSTDKWTKALKWGWGERVKIEYKKQGKKQLIGKVNAVPVLEMR